jgi:ABC-2 type transport system permease protein
MRNIYAIYRKEMGHYFVSPIAYVVVGLFLALTAFFFNFYLGQAIKASFEMQMEGMRFGTPPEFDVPSIVTRSLLGVMSMLILFFTPMLTMGVYAEERKRGTMELLMTSPITDVEIVVGKFLASLTLWIIMLLPTASFVAFMFAHSEPAPPWRVMLAAYTGALLLGGSLLALGSFVSSLTENQLISAVLTFAASLFIWILDVGGNREVLGGVLQYLSAIRHYDDFTRGIVDTSSLIYYASFIFLFIFLTVRSLDSIRWRRA